MPMAAMRALLASMRAARSSSKAFVIVIVGYVWCGMPFSRLFSRLFSRNSNSPAAVVDYVDPRAWDARK